MSISTRSEGRGLTTPPLVVSTIEEIHEIVKIIQSVGAFAFDVETRGIVERHADAMNAFNTELKQHLADMVTTSPAVREATQERLMEKWRGIIALDPLRNEVFWIGIATDGHSWAIPMGHLCGEILVPEEVGDGSTVPPTGYRKLKKDGTESEAKIRYRIPAVFSAPPEQLSRSDVFKALEPLFADPNIIKVGHNVKFDARSIRKYLNVELPLSGFMDTMLMQHIVNENLRGYSLTDLIAHNYDGHDAYYKEGKLGKIINTVAFSSATKYVHLDARWTWMLYKRLWNKIKNKEGLRNALDQDMVVLRVIMDMEDIGIPVKKSAMVVLGRELDGRMRDLLNEMSQFTPLGFNPDSNKSKQEFLFKSKADGGLGLKSHKQTAKGASSVDEEALRFIENAHPLIPLILEWQEVKKMKSTYVESLLLKLVNNSLHPSYHLHRTATGRLSSSNPNLQNIPRDSSIRSLFVAPAGHTLLVADYDQIELRVMCMFSKDKNMSKFFLEEQDIHAGAAALVLNKPVADVTSEERQLGKGVNFLTAYGGGAQKLARTTGITEKRAREVINNYYKQFSGISAWKNTEIVKAVQRGYVSTLSGRRRRLPELTSRDEGLRARAERQAINAIVQGSAADICKIAMIDVHEALKPFNAKILVQVHDELVVAVPNENVEEAQKVMVQAMGQDRVIAGIPLKVSCHSANSWSEAKGK
jgi:DNA polymerase-1